MAKKIRVWDGSAWQDVSVALPYNAVHSAQASMPSTAVDGQIWLDTDGTLSDTQYIPKTLTSTTGDIIYASSANTPARLGIGTSGQLLGISSGVPAWTTPSTTGPAFRAHTNAQQTIGTNTFTKITFGAETFDTDNCFASSRFTPNKAGYYFFHWTLDLSGITIRQMFFYLNGSDCGNVFLNAGQAHADMTNSNFVYMNGTTDYMEIYAYCNGPTVVENGTVDSYFEGFWVRG